MGNPIQPDVNDLDDEETMPEFCPKCGLEYDEIDYEYQICHVCGFINGNPEENDADTDDDDPNDSRNL